MVSRTSPRPIVIAKGCSVGSRRHEPSGKGSSAITSATSSRWAARSNSPRKTSWALRVPGLGDQRHQAVAQLGEQHPHLLGAHLGLELVEQRVVRMLEAGEALVALAVAAGEVDVRVQVGEQHREVRRLLRLYPRVLGDRRGLGHLGAQRAGDAARLLPVAGDDPHQVGVDRALVAVAIAVEGRAQLLDEVPDLVVAEHLVAHLGERAELLGARPGAGGGHHRALVPREQRGGAAQVVDLAEARPELGGGGRRHSKGSPEAETRASPSSQRWW